MKWLEHIVLNTGQRRRVSRAEVSDDAATHSLGEIRRALEGEVPSSIPPLSHYSLQATSYGPALLMSVLAPVGPHMAGRVHKGATTPVVTFGVARRNRDGRALWPALCAGLLEVLPATPPPDCPPAPWLAVVVWPALGLFPDASRWLPDFERCAAWAWIEKP